MIREALQESRNNLQCCHLITWHKSFARWHQCGAACVLLQSFQLNNQEDKRMAKNLNELTSPHRLWEGLVRLSFVFDKIMGETLVSVSSTAILISAKVAEK